MAYTTTIGITFTKTHAEHIASKIAADLYQMQRFYGSPSEQKIKDYVTELIAFLADGYLKSIDYGFKKNDEWILAISYEISQTTGGIRDDNSGRIPIGKDITGASWGSFLRYNDKYENLSSTEISEFQSKLPFKREGTTDPFNGQYSSYDKTYSTGGTDANRKIITKY